MPEYLSKLPGKLKAKSEKRSGFERVYLTCCDNKRMVGAGGDWVECPKCWCGAHVAGRSDGTTAVSNFTLCDWHR